MKTTMNLKDEIVKAAMTATGITEKTALVHRGLEELIKKSARERLIKLGGSSPDASSGPRKRPSNKTT
jgi:Arc/MetJ family transcription regulator